MPPRLAMQRKELPLNLTTPEGDVFLPSSLTMGHSVPLCRRKQADSWGVRRTREIRIYHAGASLPASRCLAMHSNLSCPITSSTGAFPSPWQFASVLFAFFSPSLETSAASGCSQHLSWSEADTSGPNGDCLHPTKTSFASSPLGQWCSVKAAMSTVRRDKHSTVGCLESLRKWSLKRMVDLL